MFHELGDLQLKEFDWAVSEQRDCIIRTLRRVDRAIGLWRQWQVSIQHNMAHHSEEDELDASAQTEDLGWLDHLLDDEEEDWEAELDKSCLMAMD